MGLKIEYFDIYFMNIILYLLIEYISQSVWFILYFIIFVFTTWNASVDRALTFNRFILIAKTERYTKQY